MVKVAAVKTGVSSFSSVTVIVTVTDTVTGCPSHTLKHIEDVIHVSRGHGKVRHNTETIIFMKP